MRRWWAVVGLLLVGSQAVRVEAARGDIVPLQGTARLLHTTLKDYSTVRVDDRNQRLYVASKAANTILALDFDGNQTAIRTTFAQPSALAVGGGSVFALLSGTGQVVQLDPVTLAPTVLAGGLVQASGLAYADGYLYVFAKTAEYALTLKRISVTTGVVTDTPVTNWLESFELFAFPQHPGVIYGSRVNVSPTGFHRWDIATGTLTYVHDTVIDIDTVSDGALLTASGGWSETPGVIGRNPSTLESVGRVWRMSDPNSVMPSSWAAGQHAVVLGRDQRVEVVSTTTPGKLYRSYTFTDFAYYQPTKVATSADSSRVFVVTTTGQYPNTNVDIYALPGVGPASTPDAPSAGNARTAAPRAQGTGNARTAAPRGQGGPAWAMKSVADIEFAPDGSVYTSDPVNGVVDRLAPDGSPMTGWRYLAGVESLAELNGSMYAAVGFEGSIVRIHPDLAEPIRVATGIPGLSGLTPAQNKLWTTYYRQYYAAKTASIDPVNGSVWLQPDDYGSGWNWSSVNLAEAPVAGHLLGSPAYGGSMLRFNLATSSFVQDQVTFGGPYAVAPDGLTVLGERGERATTQPFALDGFVFPGSGHTLSGTNASGTKLVAARSNTFGQAIVVYNEANPGDVVYAEPTLTNYQVGRMEFRPNTTELWVTLISNATGQAFVLPIDVGPAPYAAAVDDGASVDIGRLIPVRRLAAALAQVDGDATSRYQQPGGTKPTAAPSSAPSTGGAADLTPAAAAQPDPAGLPAPSTVVSGTPLTTSEPRSATSVPPTTVLQAPPNPAPSTGPQTRSVPPTSVAVASGNPKVAPRRPTTTAARRATSRKSPRRVRVSPTARR